MFVESREFFAIVFLPLSFNRNFSCTTFLFDGLHTSGNLQYGMALIFLAHANEKTCTAMYV